MSRERVNEKLKLKAYGLTATAGATAVTGIIAPLVQISLGTELSPSEAWSLGSVVAGCIAIASVLAWQGFSTLNNWID